MKWTDSTIASLELPSGKVDHIEWDPDMPGFGVRARGGRKSYILQYRVGSRQRRDTLGDIRKLKLADARRVAKQTFARVALGEDPAATKALAKETAAAKLTFGSLANRYLTSKEGELRPRTIGAASLHLRSYWKPLHNLPVDSIERATVAGILQDLIARNGRIAAARARSNLSACFAWGMREGLTDSNPVSGTSDPAANVRARERILDSTELKMIWAACENDEPFGAIIRLLILLGCRRDEIGSLRWSEINFETGALTIPGERTKNHRTLTLTLPAMALNILRAQPRRDGQEFVFGSRRRARGFNAWSHAIAAMHDRVTAANGQPLRPWTPHDLRRSMRSGLGMIGVRPDVAELCVGHAKQGIQAVYDRYSYGPEIATALLRWSEHIAAIVEGRPSNIVPLHA
jgi:integrase